MRKFLVATAALVLAGCSDIESDQLVVAVSKQPFVHQVTVQGSLAALSSTQISGPAGNVGVIDYIVPNNTAVKEGDIIARMDADAIQADLASIESDLQKVSNENRSEMIAFIGRNAEIGIQKEIVKDELSLIDRFDVDIEGVYSRIEQIDKMRNKDYTVARGDYLDWDASSNNERKDSKQTISELSEQRVTQRQQFAKMQLGSSVITAPHAGVVSLKRNWKNDTFTSGMVVFPGMTIAELPNYDDLGGELAILAVNVAGVDKGAKVEARLNAYPDVVIDGTIESISKLGSQKSGLKGSWHNAKVRFDNLPEVAKDFPTLTFTATITVQDLGEQLVIPSDLVYREDGKSWVKLVGGEVRQVELGARNLSQVVVLSGVEEGDEVTL